MARAKSYTHGLHRDTAERLLEGVLDRARQVNDPTSPYSWRVARIVVFGSYLKGKDRPNDLDLVLELARYSTNEAEFKVRELERRRRCPKRDRIEYLFWPRTEVERFLRNRSSRIVFHTVDHLDWLRENHEPYQQVFPVEAN